MSGAPTSTGTIQLPKPPIRIGITKKKIITNACDVTTTLYMCALPLNIKPPSCASSKRIAMDKTIPTIPENPPKSIYRVPICLWFVVQDHFTIKAQICFKRFCIIALKLEVLIEHYLDFFFVFSSKSSFQRLRSATQ